MIEYREWAPGARLERHLECFWVAAGTLAGRGRPEQRIVPDACPELIVQLGDRFERRQRGRWRPQPRSFVAGTLTAPWILRPGRNVHTLGVRFRPGALRAFLPVDMVLSLNRETELARIVGERARNTLRATLEAQPDDGARVDRLAEWLLERGPKESTDPSGAHAVRRILAARGECRVDRLSKPRTAERRAIQRYFRRELGISAKKFARIVRLNALLARFDSPDRDRLVDLALELGFFDQSHMSREIRLLLGRRLADSSAADGELARHFTSKERLERLLAGAWPEPRLSLSSKSAAQKAS